MAKIVVLLTILTSFFSGCHINARSKHRDTIVFHDNLNYRSPAGKETGFDLYVPKGAAKQVPAVVFVHGGYWRNQSRSYYRAFTGLYENFGLALASRGIATAVIDYRLFPGVTPGEQINDVAAAADFLHQHATEYNIDPAHIFLMGHSAGGHLALMTAWQRQSRAVRGVVALSPILDIAHMRVHKEADFNRELTVPFFGAGEKDREFSPATYAGAASQPALILFGEKDYAYLIEQGKTHSEKFSATGWKHIVIDWVKDTDHSAIVMDANTDKDRISDRITQYIKNLGATR